MGKQSTHRIDRLERNESHTENRQRYGEQPTGSNNNNNLEKLDVGRSFGKREYRIGIERAPTRTCDPARVRVLYTHTHYCVLLTLIQ